MYWDLFVVLYMVTVGERSMCDWRCLFCCCRVECSVDICLIGLFGLSSHSGLLLPCWSSASWFYPIIDKLLLRICFMFRSWSGLFYIIRNDSLSLVTISVLKAILSDTGVDTVAFFLATTSLFVTLTQKCISQQQESM